MSTANMLLLLVMLIITAMVMMIMMMMMMTMTTRRPNAIFMDWIQLLLCLNTAMTISH
jgi:hypothetical protein